MTKPSLDLTALRDAIASLEDSLEVVGDEAWFTAQSAKVRNTLLAGVIQNFEFVYEIGFKMIRRQIELEAATPTEIDQSNFRDILRLAGEKGLIEDVTAWFNYRKLRNTTAHTYDHAKALEIYRETLTFIDDARALLARLETRHG
jgi:nucleotidyltransferase substrate binding protein (TIGR01987 family)